MQTERLASANMYPCMKARHLSACLSVVVLSVLCVLTAAARRVKVSQLALADPYILLDGGTYYAYGTHSPRGIEVYSSPDLKVWHYCGLAYDKRDGDGRHHFWAPEVYKVEGPFYMYYTADERLYVARSSSPLGPFRQISCGPLLREGSIDASLFVDDDGTPYLTFVRFGGGNSVWLAELNDDLCSLKKGTLRHCLSQSQAWEKDDKFPHIRVNEGPFLIKHAGKYYLTYSANDFRSQRYGVGVAIADSLTAEWHKVDYNPVLQGIKGLVGTGHHSFFRTKRGRLMMAFHTHQSTSQVHPRLTYFVPVKFVRDAHESQPRLAVGRKLIIPSLKP